MNGHLAAGALTLLLAGGLAACGKADEPPSKAVAVAKSKPAGQGAATAEQVAKDARSDVKCPAKIKSPARATGAPVDDVLGVRPGMGHDEAANAVLCTHDLLVMQNDVTRGFNLKTYGQKLRHGFGARFAEPRVEWTAKRAQAESLDQMLARSGNAARDDMKPGQTRWYVGTMGLPGEERVINVAREERFDTGASPTIASIEQALLKKYGPATKQQNNNGPALHHLVLRPDGAPGHAGRAAVQPLQRQRQSEWRRQPVAGLRHRGHGDRGAAAREPRLGAVDASRRGRSGRWLPADHHDRAGAGAGRPAAPRQGDRQCHQECGGAEVVNRSRVATLKL